MNKGQKAKPRVAFFDFTSCEGCQLTVVDSLQYHPELLEVIDIVEFREASSDRSAITRSPSLKAPAPGPATKSRLHTIRETADIVVAWAPAPISAASTPSATGKIWRTCATTSMAKAEWYETYEPRPISKVIAVDVVVPGCPISGAEFVRVVKGCCKAACWNRLITRCVSSAS
jgi:sulfhydrogenase subunit delta